MPGGIDLLRVCVSTSWEQHEQEFAKWLLFETCTATLNRWSTVNEHLIAYRVHFATSMDQRRRIL
jgi:hypothetical protein